MGDWSHRQVQFNRISFHEPVLRTERQLERLAAVGSADRSAGQIGVGIEPGMAASRESAPPPRDQLKPTLLPGRSTTPAT
jgi:hypothetical protein